MGKITGFLEIDRSDRRYEPAGDRVQHFREFMIPLGEDGTRRQAARCMDCGIPFCHTSCPVNRPLMKRPDVAWEGPASSRPPEALIEWLRTHEPLDGKFPEIEDLPPEEVAVFDDFPS